MPILQAEVTEGITAYLNLDEPKVAEGPVVPIKSEQVGNRLVSMIKPNPTNQPDQYEIAIPGIEFDTNHSVIRMEGQAFANIIFELIVLKLRDSQNPATAMEEVYKLIYHFEIE